MALNLNADGDGIVRLQSHPLSKIVTFTSEAVFREAAAAGELMLERMRDARVPLGTVTVRAGETVRERLTLPPR